MMKRKTPKELLAESFRELAQKAHLANLLLHTGGHESFIRWVRQHLSLMQEIGMDNYLIEQLGE